MGRYRHRKMKEGREGKFKAIEREKIKKGGRMGDQFKLEEKREKK
jgi:hypothetical protein